MNELNKMDVRAACGQVAQEVKPRGEQLADALTKSLLANNPLAQHIAKHGLIGSKPLFRDNAMRTEAMDRVGEISADIAQLNPHCIAGYDRAALGADRSVVTEWLNSKRATLSREINSDTVILQYGDHAVRLPVQEFKRIATEFLGALAQPEKPMIGSHAVEITGATTITSFPNCTGANPRVLDWGTFDATKAAESEADRIMRVTRGMV